MADIATAEVDETDGIKLHERLLAKRNDAIAWMRANRIPMLADRSPSTQERQDNCDHIWSGGYDPETERETRIYCLRGCGADGDA